MSEQKTLQPTIAELWRRLDECARMHFLFPEWAIQDADYYESLGKEIEALRAQLIRICDNHHFNYIPPEMDAPADEWISYHRDMAVFHAFWAWETEQRQKEATPPQVIP